MRERADCSNTPASAAAVGDCLRELTANLLRVARGAGRPELIVSQTTALATCFAAHRTGSGSEFAGEDIADVLKLAAIPSDEGEVWPDWDRAVREIVKGALQVAAAEILVQHAQAAAGRRELFAGYRDIEKLHTRQLRRLLRRQDS